MCLFLVKFNDSLNTWKRYLVLLVHSCGFMEYVKLRIGMLGFFLEKVELIIGIIGSYFWMYRISGTNYWYFWFVFLS